jgi:hypothetical protein
MTVMSDEVLMSYADGELGPDEARPVRAAVAGDRDIAARVALFRETRRVAQDAFSGMLREPMPEHLIRAIVPSARPARTARWRPAAMAAAFVLAVGTAGWLGYSAGGSGRDGAASPFAALAESEPALASALSQSPDGAERSWTSPRGRSGRIAVGATYRLDDGRTCRSFEAGLSDDGRINGLSCRIGPSWAVAFAARGPLPTRAGDGAYRPAGAAAGDLAAVLDARHAQGPLSAEDVRRLIERGWTE